MTNSSISLKQEGYVGRYAPSPTGHLHFGSLITAVASYLDAQANGGIWLLRIDDLDQPRVEANAAADILNTLDQLGFEWHGEVIHQSKRTEAYISAFEELFRQDLTYACICTRKEIADSATQGIDGFVYPGTCRHGMIQNKNNPAWRIKCYQQCKTEPPQHLKSAPPIFTMVLFRRRLHYERRAYGNSDFASTRAITT